MSMIKLADRASTQLRFAVGARVECFVGEWVPGTIAAQFYTQDDFPDGMCAAYQIELDEGDVVFAPQDSDKLVRKLMHEPTPIDENAELRRAAALISDADAVVIAAGAGMSIPAGIDYTSEKIFKERYPGMLQYGLRRCYDTFGFSGFRENKALNWGYMCEHGHYSTAFIPTDPTYYTLRKLVGDKPYFVATSNADGLFARTGFDRERIWTPQGSYDTLQCKNSCGHVFSSLETIAKVRANTDKATMMLDTSRCPVPKCPNCGNDCCFNLNGGAYYINKHWEKDRKAMHAFIDETLAAGKKLAILEVGISVYNTPGVIRYPMEQVLRRRPTPRSSVSTPTGAPTASHAMRAGTSSQSALCRSQ